WGRSEPRALVAPAVGPAVEEGHDNISTFAAAYALGKQESTAAVFLVQRVPTFVKESLVALEQLQRVCGIFQHCLQQFLSSVPKGFADSVLPEIHKAFELRHADSDLQNLMEHSVPPADLAKVTVFASHMQRYHQEAPFFSEQLESFNGNHLEQYQLGLTSWRQAEKETKDKAQELAARLLQTTWEQTQLQILEDIAKLRDWSSRFLVFSKQQASLDFKHLNDRYVRGKAAVDAYMESHHQLVHVNSLVMAHGNIVTMQQSLPQNALTILLVDATVWPSRALAIDECIQLCQGISTGNSRTFGFFLLPQAWNASHRAQVHKNKRLLEDKIQGRLGRLWRAQSSLLDGLG
ncbi:unnamed protein product, partial [Durusdinium trenchii]